MKILFIVLLSFSTQLYAFVYYEEGMPDAYKNIVVEDIELLHSLSLLNKNSMTKIHNSNDENSIRVFPKLL